MRRAPVLLLAALSPTSAAIVADVSGCAAVDQYKSSTWEENGLNKFSLAIEVSNWLNNGRVELRWAQALSVEKVFQATLLPQTEGSVATFLLPDHISYESSEGSFTVMGSTADLALPMVTCKAGDGHASPVVTTQSAAAGGGAADPNAPCAHVDLSGSSAWEQNDDLHFSFRFQVDHFTPFAQIHVRALPSCTATLHRRAPPTARRRPRALLRRRSRGRRTRWSSKNRTSSTRRW